MYFTFMNAFNSNIYFYSYLIISCLSPAESGLHWYWAWALREQRRRVTTESLTMMTRRITDDGGHWGVRR